MEDNYRRIEDMDDEKLFSNKLKSIEYVQINFNDNIRKRVLELINSLMVILAGKDLDEECLDLIDDELISNLKELELNIGTIIVNCQRVTGLKIKISRNNKYKRKRSFFKKGQLLFLLDGNTSMVYGKTLVYLQEELRKELISLREDLDKIKDLEEDEIQEYIKYLEGEYFKINSDMYIIVDDINEAIDLIYANISSNRDKNINLSFLLISAFLSVILFFPEFNNMLNLKNDELTLEERIDEIIYNKIIERTDLEELIDIKLNIEDYPLRNKELLEDLDPNSTREIEEEVVRNIILDNINNENERLEREKDRINIFVRLLFIILVPFLIWIIFISI